MQNLKKMIRNYMTVITFSTALIILWVVFGLQMLNEQGMARVQAESMLEQMEHILSDNEKELTEIEAEYQETCLHDAEAIAYIIQQDPSVAQDITKLQEIADFIEVDEIHIFDTTGRIVAGTNPEYYDLTFDSGEQMRFFKPMLEDKTLRLCQETTPNTAEGKMMQYSAVWSEKGEFILQVGLEPVNILRKTEKNSLSYIFSLLKVHAGANLYAINKDSGEIVASTDADDIGKHASDVGLKMERIQNKTNGFHAKVNGVYAYCVFKLIDGNYIGRTISIDALYEAIPLTVLFFALGLVAVSFILITAATRYMNKYVVNEIKDMNTKLREITAGNLEESVQSSSSVEFVELSNYINEMLESILDNERKMFYVLKKTNMRIGTYEYSRRGRNIRLSEEFRRIFELDKTQEQLLLSNYEALEEFLMEIRNNPIQGEDAVYCLNGENECYVKIDEIIELNAVFGIVIDVTEDIIKRNQLKIESDLDSLTGIYNRRGMEKALTELFKEPEELDYAALIVVDADGLKDINDQYGHEKGDIYIRHISELLSNFGTKNQMAARFGGDEFVLFLYHYEDKASLLNEIKSLEYTQEHSTVSLGDGVNVPLRFSMGYSLVENQTDYEELIKQADQKMYENKREHKNRDNQE